MFVFKAGVVGAGTMGGEIAQLVAAAGIPVVLRDVEQRFVDVGLEKARQLTAGRLDGLVASGKLTRAQADDQLEQTLALISGTTSLDRFGDVDFVIEAVPERLELKHEIYGRLSEIVSGSCVLATNTSSLPVTAIAAGATHPERVVGMHFFNPPVAMPLVEIVRGDATNPHVVERAYDFAVSLGKEPIVVRDLPGFATSRLGILLGLEAARMLEEGVASAADIDRAMVLGYGHPMGPLALGDLVGLDVRLAVAEHLERELGPHFEPPQILRDLVAAGHLGRKTGRGFHEYPREETR
jgi:3-hydroxybutyryl-CoA dehydrogenase